MGLQTHVGIWVWVARVRVRVDLESLFGVSALQGSDGGGRDCPSSLETSRAVVVVGMNA